MQLVSWNSTKDVLFIFADKKVNLYNFERKKTIWRIVQLFSSVQSLSHVQLFATLWTAECQASLSITNSWSQPKPLSIESDAIQPSYPLLSPSPPALNVSKHQGLFKWVSTSHQLAKVLEFLLEVQIFFNSRFFQLQFSVLRGQIHLCGGVCPMPIGCLKHPWPPWILAQYDRQIFLQALFSIPLETRLLLLE